MSVESVNDRTVAFFDLIHPPKLGDAPMWRCLFTLPDRRHHWVSNSVDLVRIALELDFAGYTVFHSCAVFNAKERRQEHVAALGCFWFDIDAGASKPYADAVTAYRALKEWLAAVKLPVPIIVSSGGGLHAYWPLRSPLGLAEWRRGANHLRALAEKHGLELDAGSTIDAARILRPPGTYNRKIIDENGRKVSDTGGPARQVQCGPLRGPYSLSELGLDSAEQANVGLSGQVPSFLRGVKDGEGIFNIGGDDRGDADPQMVVERCLQVRELRERRGDLPEPRGYAVLGVLAHCGAAGTEYAHSLATDPSWIPLIDSKLVQWRKNADGPTTCSHFQTINPLGCEFCPHRGKITTPVQLGRDLPVSVLAPAPAGPDLPPLPRGFKWDGQRLCAERKPTDDDPSTQHIITEYPVVVGALQEAERSRRISAVFRSWEPATQDWREFVLNMGELKGQGGAAKVADHGVVIPKKRWDKFIECVDGFTIDHRGTKLYSTRYEQFGWKSTPDGGGGVRAGPAFVLGAEIHRAGAAPERIHGTDELERRGTLMASCGDPRAWSEAANKLIAHAGMEAHVFMLLCAFAAPLYAFISEAGVTFVHGATRETARGKTTIQDAGASIWGGRDATSITERDTMVAKFVTLGTLCHLPVFFDELRFPNADETKHYVLQATIGRDKQRGKAEGGLRTDQLAWSTIHISAANLSLVDTVRADGAEVAQAARIFEFSLSLPSDVKTTDGDALVRQLWANRGTAGRKFIGAVLERHAEISAAVPERMARYEQAMQAGPDERFILRLFACVDVAADIVREQGLLAFDKDAVMTWAQGVQKVNAQRLAVEATVDAGSVVSQMLNDMMATNMLAVVKPAEIGKPQTVEPLLAPRGELHARFEIEGRKLLIEHSAARRWLQEHKYSFTEMQKELTGLGILKESRIRRTLGAGTKFAVGQVWCWQLDGTHPLLAGLADALPGADNVVPIRGVG